MRKFFFVIFIMILLGPFSVAGGESIVVAAFEYPPIYQNSADKGLSGDIVEAAFRAAGIEAELRFFPVNRMVQVVSSGEAVCGIGGAILFADPDVAANVTVGDRVQYVVQTFLYDARNFPQDIRWGNLAELSKYRVGVLGGSGIARFLERVRSLDLNQNTVHEGSAKQLQAGRIDLWAIVDLTGIMYMKRLFPSESANYRFTKAFNLGDVSVVFSKKADPDGAYLARFRKGLSAIKKNGIYMNIFEKYYGGKDAINRDALTDDMK